TNRTSVLLSRAREGMYLIGNSELMASKSKDMWAPIIHILHSRNQVGFGMPIQCDRHPLNKHTIKEPEQFKLVNTNGELAKIQAINHISSVETNPFNYIQLNRPTVNIRSGDGLKVCCNSNFRDDSEFISIKATISPGISATSYIEIEKLQKLLINRKDDIDDLLKLQTVYAIGIDFQNDSIRPCISCWVAKPLDISILEGLEAMFENQYEAIYQISIPDQSDIKLSSNSDNLIEEFGNINLSKNYLPNDEENLKKEQESVKKEEIDKSNEKDFITIISDAIVTTVDQKYNQRFAINTHLRAKFSPPILEYEFDIYQCTTGQMLSKNLPFYRRGHGYFLDSVDVHVSPIPYKPEDQNVEKINLFSLLGNLYPQQLNRNVEISNGRETNFEGQIGVSGQIPNISAKGGVKYVTNTKYTSDEWTMNYCSDHHTGNIWNYRYVANKLDKDGDCRTSYKPGYHSAKWRTKETMRGFCITITQVVRYRITLWGKIKQNPELIKCPIIAHNLEIVFNNFKDFNSNFAKLAGSNEGTYDIDNSIDIGIKDIQNLDGNIKIKRSFTSRNK
ncbi:17511_t:CDS:2, partial [Funneliformis geosporum]